MYLLLSSPVSQAVYDLIERFPVSLPDPFPVPVLFVPGRFLRQGTLRCTLNAGYLSGQDMRFSRYGEKESLWIAIV